MYTLQDDDVEEDDDEFTTGSTDDDEVECLHIDHMQCKDDDW